MRRSVTMLTSILCLSTTLVWAHGKATGIVRERMDQMVELKDAMKLLKAELTKGEEYDSAIVLNAAKTVAAHSGEALTVKFPEGSLTKHSEALPSVWKNPDRFAALAHEMGRLAGEMERSIDAGIPNVQTSTGLLNWLSGDNQAAPAAELRSPIDTFIGISETCRVCHDEFRQE